jgi:hypothetical protein
MNKSSKSPANADRFPRDSKSGHRAKSATLARRQARAVKRAGQGR